ncbi:MAG: response regulator [Pirellulaceae bacterium]
MKRVRMVVVDDSTLFRKVVRDVVASHPAVDVVGVAADGLQAIEKIEQLEPDLVTLDMQMPNVDGLGVLRSIKSKNLSTGVIMLSSFTAQGAQETLQALELGAFDFILKPRTASLEASIAELQGTLLPKIDAFTGTSTFASTAAPVRACPLTAVNVPL